jgi:hypothetical protein
MRIKGTCLATTRGTRNERVKLPISREFLLDSERSGSPVSISSSRAVNEHRQVVRALLAVLVTWLPLVILALLQGLAYSSQIKIPFFRDFAANVRFLIALPILILAESGIDQRNSLGPDWCTRKNFTLLKTRSKEPHVWNSLSKASKNLAFPSSPDR